MSLARGLRTLCWALLVAVLGWSAIEQQAPAADAGPNWPEILGKPQDAVPPAQKEVVWRNDLTAGMAEAAQTGRPLLVLLRCPPCKQSSVCYQQVMLGGEAMDPLLKQFVTVRVISAQDLDQRLFPMEGFQDYDMSLWVYFFSPDGRVYSIFGGRDERNDQTRVSPEALITQMRRVLAHHYDPRRAAWDVDGPAPDLAGAKQGPYDLPGYAAWSAAHPNAQKAPPNSERDPCLHCHQVAEIRRLPAITAGTFDKHGAARIGVQTGDVLAAAGGRRLYGQTDFRGVLHRGPRGGGEIPLVWRHGNELKSGVLAVAEGWRKTVLDWRMSVSQGDIGSGPGFFPINVPEAERQRLGLADTVMAVRPFMGPRPSGPAYAAGAREEQVLTAVDGQSPPLVGRAFLVWFRLRYEKGDEVTLTLRARDGKELQVKYKLAE
ncbi:MAG: thioredoxin family protein [Armatimonadetes bacterium]|nr:thioredoxin family protein [Armatimonadota bacterium]